MLLTDRQTDRPWRKHYLLGRCNYALLKKYSYGVDDNLGDLVCTAFYMKGRMGAKSTKTDVSS